MTLKSANQIQSAIDRSINRGEKLFYADMGSIRRVYAVSELVNNRRKEICIATTEYGDRRRYNLRHLRELDFFRV